VTELSRRRFLVAGFGTAASVAFVSSNLDQLAFGVQSRERLSPSLFDDPAGIQALGSVAVVEGFTAAGAPTDAAALRGAIAADVASGAFEHVGGWTLTKAEIGACVREYEAIAVVDDQPS
jgi:hypothetical protein